jgi:hypothetical protein
MEYDVNKGVGKQVEFKGLTAMYLFILAGGLAAVLLAVVVLYLAGAGQWTCILGGIFAGSLLAWGVFRLNARFGEHGLMKMLAEKRHPRYLIRRRKIFRVLNSERKP